MQLGAIRLVSGVSRETNVPPARASCDQIHSILQTSCRLGANEFPANCNANGTCRRFQHTVVLSTNVVAIFPHCRNVLVMAEIFTARKDKKKTVEAIITRPCDKRPSNHTFVFTRKLLHELKRFAFERTPGG